MQNEKNDINWNEILEKLSKHEGTIKDFCMENKIDRQKLYRRRKKQEKISNQTFHSITIPKAVEKEYSQEVKIEIGAAKIYIPKGDKATLLYVLKELLNIC